MPRKLGFAVDVKPVKGLVTEFSEAEFPENAAIDADNIAFYKTSVDESVSFVSTRPGFDFETGYQFFSLPTGYTSSSVLTSYEWKNPGNDNTALSFLVQQIGNELQFFEVNSVSNTVTYKAPVFVIDLELYKVAGAPSTADRYCDFAEGKGYLFIAHPFCDPLYVSYDTATATFSVNQITIKTRDVEGLDDGLAYTLRPDVLSPEHHYNLLNQGWTQERIDNFYVVSATYVSPQVYPSNSDIWWYYKDAYDNYYAKRAFIIESELRLNMPAPRGVFILEEFNKDRSAVSGVAGIPVTSAGYNRPPCIAYLGGRLFYASPPVKDYYGKIYFSQIIERIDYAGLCFQKNDPTSETISDLLDTDGGVISIGDTGVIYKIVPYRNGLLVFAEKGVWRIAGSTDTGMFKPTDFSVNKLSGVPVYSNTSFVIANGTPFWWSPDGIYSVAVDQMGFINVVTLTEDTIKQFFNSIDPDGKSQAKGAFDPIGELIIWHYRDNGKDKFLVFSIKFKSFSPWSIEMPDGFRLADVVSFSVIKNRSYNEFIIDSSYTDVVTSTNDSIVIKKDTLIYALPFVKFLIIDSNGNRYTYGEFNTYDSTYDFSSEITYKRGFKAYLTLGHRAHGQLVRKFQSNYIFVFLKNVPHTSCLFSYEWDYRKRDPDNPWKKYEVYKDKGENVDIVERRLKVRGKGRVLTFTFENTPGRVFHLIGFGTREAIDGDVNG